MTVLPISVLPSVGIVVMSRPDGKVFVRTKQEQRVWPDHRSRSERIDQFETVPWASGELATIVVYAYGDPHLYSEGESQPSKSGR